MAATWDAYKMPRCFRATERNSLEGALARLPAWAAEGKRRVGPLRAAAQEK